LDLTVRKFQPIGVTVLGLLAESHISLHTYPEINYVAIDIFTCGKNKPEPILEYLQEKFGAKEVRWEYLRRGVMKQWQTFFENDGYRREIEVQKVLHRRVTPYQTLEVIRAKKLGTCLFSNGTLQMATLDAHEYDAQMLAHLGDVEKVLIVGGGDCSILKELVKNKSIKDIYMLEQDQQVIEIARKYLGAAQALKDPRLKMFYGNATETISYLKDKEVDVALFDIINYPEHKARSFYSKLFEQLSSIGCPRFVTQAGHALEKEEKNVIITAAKKYYKNIETEEKYCFSTGMLKFLYGSGLR